MRCLSSLSAASLRAGDPTGHLTRQLSVISFKLLISYFALPASPQPFVFLWGSLWFHLSTFFRGGWGHLPSSFNQRQLSVVLYIMSQLPSADLAG